MKNGRVAKPFESSGHRKKQITSPEGVVLDVSVATIGERASAFAIDMLIIGGIASVCLTFLIVIALKTKGSEIGMLLGGTFFLFCIFLLRTVYFTHFELAWQGRTPGKKLCGLRVIHRKGGELEPSSIVARNLTREVEFFAPQLLALQLLFKGNHLGATAALGWIIALLLFPLLNKDRLRLGDLIGGTQVISMPQRALLPDLIAGVAETQPGAHYTFTHEQLAIYGTLELQVLEEFLRRPPSAETTQLLSQICDKICRKIGWQEVVPSALCHRFLSDFYAAERETLERGQLFGRYKEKQRTEG